MLVASTNAWTQWSASMATKICAQGSKHFSNPRATSNDFASKASTGRINPRELGQLRQGLEAVQSIAALSAGEAPLLPYLERLTPCDQLLERLRSELVEEPPVNPAKGQVIEQGVSAELDELRTLKSNAQAALDAYLRGRPSVRAFPRSRSRTTRCLAITSKCATRTRTKCRRSGFASRP